LGHDQAGLGVVPLLEGHAAFGGQLAHPFGIVGGDLEVRIGLLQGFLPLFNILAAGAFTNEVELSSGQLRPGLGLAELDIGHIMLDENEDVAHLHPAPLIDLDLPDLSADTGSDIDLAGFDGPRGLNASSVLCSGTGYQAAERQEQGGGINERR